MASLPLVLEHRVRGESCRGRVATPMVRASVCLLAGMLVPQLSSFPRHADLFHAGVVLLELPWLVPAVPAAVAGAWFALPPAARPALAWFIAGVLSFCLHIEFVAASRLPPAYIGDSLVADVRIVDFPRADAAGTSFAAEPVAGSRLPPRLQIAWYEAPVSLRQGDVWRFELRLKPPHGTLNPGAMDYEKWLVSRRIGATGYVVSGPRNRLIDSDTAGLAGQLRGRFVERVQQVVDDPESAAVLVALVVGSRHLLSDAQWERYAATGTSHLMAISGLHVGLAAAGAYLALLVLGGAAGGAYNVHRAALVGALLFAVGYAAISGFAVPAQRASLMLGLFVLAALSRRQVDAARVLAAAALAVLCADPLAALQPGFLLSFAAVAILLWLGRRRVRPVGGRLVRAAAGLSALAVVQVALLLGLAPLCAVLFDRISLAAPAVNLLAVPVFSLVTVPAALLGFALGGPAAVAGDLMLAVSAASI
ncbi:MAG TPA: ComEC/Rec2 family competence protein, partial [Woeseiaceae bacterium]|nr:ComEC/Rec2 family competence protein [Woeseiaceae bacterium]